MLVPLFIVVLNLLLALIAYYNFYHKRRGLPPGPTPLPILGNLLSLQRYMHCQEKLYLKWRDEYGPIYTYWLGELPVVCVAEHSLMMEMFQKDGDTYAGRFTFKEFDEMLRGGTRGVVMTEGDLWRDQRRFALRVLRDFGLSKNVMQERVLAEVERFIGAIRDDEVSGLGDEVDVIKYLDICVGSIINSIMFGYRFDGKNEEQFYHLKAMVKRIFEVFTNMGFTLVIQKPSVFSRFPYFRTMWTRMLKADQEMNGFFQAQIDEHVHELKMAGALESGVPTDYVHAYLQEKARRDKLEGEGQHNYSIAQLKGMCNDIWIAGQETSSITLTWGIAHLIQQPKFQARLHAELDTVIGPDRWVTVADRPHLPFTCACVAEMQRVANILPMNVLRRVTRDVEVQGYKLHEGTVIIPQISAVLYDPMLYADPERFDPTRHLDEEGRLCRCDELIPFSIGKRQCLGESLARMELFLFLANAFKRYRFSPSTKHPMPEVSRGRGTSSTLAICPQFVCHVESR